MSEHIAISTHDLPPAPTPIYDPVWKYYRGEPWVRMDNGDYFYNVPDVPHVHSAKVGFIDESGGLPKWLPEPAAILTAHGQRNAEGEWVFRDGRSVTGFTQNYNLQNPLAPIDAVAVCNPTAEQEGRATHVRGGSTGVSGYKDGDQTVVILTANDAHGAFVQLIPRL